MDDKFRPMDGSFSMDSTQTIELTELFTQDLTATGSFDVRSSIWKTTFGKIIQALPIPTFLIDPSFRIIVTNQAWRGISERYEETRGRLFSTLFPGTSSARRAQSILENVFATRKPVAAHATLQIQERKIWARMTFRSVRIMEERLVLVLVEDLTAEKRLAQQNKKHLEELERRVEERTSELMAANAQLKEEVAERKRMEMTLRASEERYRALYEDNPSMYFTMDAQGTVLSVNRFGAEELGYSVEELVGQPVLTVFREDDREAVRRQFTRCLQNPMQTAHWEFRKVRKDGSILWVKEVARSILDVDGNPVVLVVCENITAQKKAEEALRAERERFQMLSERAPFGMVMIAEDGTFEYVNPKFTEIFGYDLSDAPNGEVWTRLAYPDPAYRKEVLSTWIEDRKQVKIGETRPRIFEVTCKDGRKRMIDFRPVRLAMGQDLMTCEDITDRTLAEAGLRRAHDELEDQVQESTAELQQTNEQLRREMAERKEAENALLRSEEKYRLLVEKAPVGIVSIDTEGRVLEVNQKLLGMLGSPSAEATKAINVLTFELLVASGVSSIFSRCLELRTDKSGEVPYTSKWGKKLYLRTLATPLFDERNNLIGCQAVMEDVSERKKVEQALWESEERLDLALKGADLGLWDYNLQTGEAVINARRAEMVGYSLEEAEPTMTWWGSQVHPEDFEPVREAFNDHANGRTPVYESQHRLRHKSGEYIWILARGKIVEWNESGYPVRIVGTSLDITDRKRAEEALLSARNELESRVEERTAELKRSEEKYRALFEESLNAVFITTRDGRLVDANQAFLGLFGLTREEANDLDVLKIYTDAADRRRFQEDIERNGSVRDYEVSFRKKDGTRIEGLLSSSVRRDRDGTILGYQGIIRDVTERRMLQRQLLQAQKMEAVGTLAGGIAHDFNNLLQVTMGYAEVLLSRKDKADPEYARLQQILQAGRSGSELVQRLLTLSRKTESKQRPIDLNYQIEQVRRLLVRTIPKMINIDLQLADSLATVNADPTQLEQIIMNLALNARDAMPEGGKLTLSTENVTLDEDYCRMHPGAKPGNYIVLAISDTGLGMDKEILDHIFEPFFTTKGVGMGTGLGLAVVYGIVKQHGGYVTSESQPGHGTIFNVYLPAIEEQEIVSDESAEEPRLPGGTETILLVEDEEVVRDLGELILCECGYRVLTAKNGKEALAIYL